MRVRTYNGNKVGTRRLSVVVLVEGVARCPVKEQQGEVTNTAGVFIDEGEWVGGW